MTCRRPRRDRAVHRRRRAWRSRSSSSTSSRPAGAARSLVVSLGGLAIVAALTIATGRRVAGGDGTVRVDGVRRRVRRRRADDVPGPAVRRRSSRSRSCSRPDYLEPRGLPLAEFAIVLLFAMTGAMLIAGSADLLVLFIALELMVLPGYMLAGYHKTDGYSTEGAIKYFLLGSFSSAIFLFGLAFAWGATGTTSIAGVARRARRPSSPAAAALSPALVLGLGFMTTGVAFKIAAVPFHYWTPDAYQGSPTPVTGYLSVGPKVGAFALILRLFVEALGPLRADWLQVVIVLADPDDDARQPRRADPDERQADARVLVDRPHRLHARRARGVRRRADRGPRGPALLRRRVLGHEPRRVRGRRGDPAPRRRHVRPRHVRRASAGASRGWRS